MIIGKQGTHIKWMKRNSRCSIEVDRDAQTVTVVGQPADVEVAKKLIGETLEKAQNKGAGGARAAPGNAEHSGDEEMAPASETTVAEAGELAQDA